MNTLLFDEDPGPAHTISCAVLHSDDPCDCPARDDVEFPLLVPEAGSTADKLDQLAREAR